MNARRDRYYAGHACTMDTNGGLYLNTFRGRQRITNPEAPELAAALSLYKPQGGRFRIARDGGVLVKDPSTGTFREVGSLSGPIDVAPLLADTKPINPFARQRGGNRE